MSLPYFPFYPDDYEADTAHLSLEEDGAYMRLLRLCWRSPGCSIPADAAWIARKMRVTPAKFKSVVEPVLAEFFVQKTGRLYSERLLKEWSSIELAHKRRVEAGRRGGAAKSRKNNETIPSKAQAMLKQCSSNQNQNQNHIREEPYQEVRTSELGDMREGLRVVPGGGDA